MRELQPVSDTPLFGAVRFTGPQARDFLQGQLSQDILLLSSERSLLASHNTPQGRVVAVLRLYQDRNGIVALLPATMVASLIERLRKYVLRTQVTIADASRDSPRFAAAMPAAGITTATANDWRLSEIRAGQPQIYPETTELFVAQMLNLDLIDGISFNKGCFTGQEVIARTHYRGRIKRRMQRFRTLEPAALAPGHAGRFADGRAFKAVETARLPDGRCEFLAVAPLAATEAVSDDDAAHAQTQALAVEALALPYALPH
jgi:folate-binding protein YgfZ